METSTPHEVPTEPQPELKPHKKYKLVWIWIGVAFIGVLIIVGIYSLIRQKETPVVNPLATSTSPLETPAASSTVSENIPAEWKTYTDEGYGFQFKYPESIIFSKTTSVVSPENGTPTSYKAGAAIPVQLFNVTDEQVLLSPLYVTFSVEKKPQGYHDLKSYVAGVVSEAVENGQRSAAGVYATSSVASQNGLSGYLVVISDGSVLQNRDDKYYYEKDNYIYSFDVVYSGYNYGIKEPDEVTRVNIAKEVLASFTFK